jgi:hypothetical protein
MSLSITYNQIVRGNESLQFPNSNRLTLTSRSISSDSSDSITPLTPSVLTITKSGITASNGTTVFPNPYAGTTDSGFNCTGSILGLASDAPTNVVAVAGTGQATISFDEPVYDGCSPIQYYIVYSSSESNVTGMSSPIVFNGLTLGQTYTFIVQAVNESGIAGLLSEPSNEVTINALSSISLTQSAYTLGSSVPITVSLSGTVSQNTNVHLSTNNPSAFVYLSPICTVLSGTSSATVNAILSTQYAYAGVTITASLGSSSVSVTFNGVVDLTAGSYNLQVPDGTATVELFMIAGGGGGGSQHAGGGGAGSYYFNSNYVINDNAINSVIVGSGGYGASYGGSSYKGSDTTYRSITVYGGGGGGSYVNGIGGIPNPKNGGCGGGGQSYNNANYDAGMISGGSTTSAGNSSTSGGKGFNGGSGQASLSGGVLNAGGGGGCGSSGSNGSYYGGGNGGDAIPIGTSGTQLIFGGGGGGGAWDAYYPPNGPGKGGSYGGIKVGGDASNGLINHNLPGDPGVADTGSGGGGGGSYSCPGGNGAGGRLLMQVKTGFVRKY